jgi:hypothetical protein
MALRERMPLAVTSGSSTVYDAIESKQNIPVKKIKEGVREIKVQGSKLSGRLAQAFSARSKTREMVCQLTAVLGKSPDRRDSHAAGRIASVKAGSVRKTQRGALLRGPGSISEHLVLALRKSFGIGYEFRVSTSTQFIEIHALPFALLGHALWVEPIEKPIQAVG